MKKLLLDANPSVPFLLSGRLNGIGRTNLELIRALDYIPASEIPFDIELFTQNVKGVSASRLGTRFKTLHLYLRNNPGWNKWAAKLRVREFVSRYDLMHITHNFEVVAHPEKCIVTIHDAMMFSYPEQFLNHDFARKHYPPFARKAKAVITCSENSKREIAEYMDVNPDQIHVIPWGVDHSVLNPHPVAPSEFTNGKPYFCSVSCDIGRKNTVGVVKAYIDFFHNNPEHHLVLVWKNPSQEVLEIIEKNPHAKDKIHFVTNLSNRQLADIYVGASCTFFPSRYEGFGLPVAESMACGTPVVTCDNSSLREVGGDAAFYVDPDDVQGMAAYMEKFENGELKKSDFADANVLQSMNFTWEKCARKTLQVYKNCLDSL